MNVQTKRKTTIKILNKIIYIINFIIKTKYYFIIIVLIGFILLFYYLIFFKNFLNLGIGDWGLGIG